MANPTQPDPCGLGWTPKVDLVRLSWIFLTHHVGMS